MKVVAIAMVRDEADVIWHTLCHLVSEGVTDFVLADNLSTDGTTELLHSFSLCSNWNATLLVDPEPGYYQAVKMTRLARMACDLGADWVLPFDADEIVYSPDGRRVVDVLAHCMADVVQMPVYDHLARDDDPVGGNPFKRSGWRRRERQKFYKVAFRADPHATLHMGNHDVVRPGAREVGTLEVRHFQYRSLGQMTRKLRQGKAAYDATDLHEGHGTHWREGGAKTDEQLAADWEALCNEAGLIFDPAPVGTLRAPASSSRTTAKTAS